MGLRINKFDRRASRVRYKLKKVSKGLPRLTVFKSNKYLYVQIVDDVKGHTILSVSTQGDSCNKFMEVSANGVTTNSRCNVTIATALGKSVAERAIAVGVTKVIFDRGGYAYHGCVKAIAEAARLNGLIV